MKSKVLSWWEEATNKLAEEFVKVYHGEEMDWYWIGDEVGGVIEVGYAEGFYTLKEIVPALRLNCPKAVFLEWYNYNNDKYQEWLDTHDGSPEPADESLEYFIDKTK